MRRPAALALGALVMMVAITAAWWALALWPAGTEAPAWLERTRAVCFGVSRDGLPDLAGWVVLISEPFGMFAFLGLVWRDELREALGTLRRTTRGRLALGTVAVMLMGGVGAVAVRVVGVAATPESFDPRSGPSADLVRVDRPAPPLSLVDHHGRRVQLEELQGRPVVLAFAYGHCQTVCPLLVRDAVAAVEQAKASNPALLIVTLDPWRDTPSRLPSIARAWKLPPEARLLGGSVEAVEAALQAWQIPRTRDESTGEIIHATTTYLIDRRGHVTFISGGDAAQLAALIRRL